MKCRGAGEHSPAICYICTSPETQYRRRLCPTPRHSRPPRQHRASRSRGHPPLRLVPGRRPQRGREVTRDYTLLWEHRHEVDCGGFRAAHHDVEVLDGLAGGALADVVDYGDYDRTALDAVLKHVDQRKVGAAHVPRLRHLALRQHPACMSVRTAGARTGKLTSQPRGVASAGGLGAHMQCSTSMRWQPSTRTHRAGQQKKSLPHTA